LVCGSSELLGLWNRAFELELQSKEMILLSSKVVLLGGRCLYKTCGDDLLQRCVPEKEIHSIISHCHDSPYGAHASVDKTTLRFFKLDSIIQPFSKMLIHTFEMLKNQKLAKAK